MWPAPMLVASPLEPGGPGEGEWGGRTTDRRTTDNCDRRTSSAVGLRRNGARDARADRVRALGAYDRLRGADRPCGDGGGVPPARRQTAAARYSHLER